MSTVAQHSKDRHGSDRLNDDDAVQDQVPKRERAAKPGRGRGWSGSRGFHESGYWIMAEAKLSILKRFHGLLTSYRGAIVRENATGRAGSIRLRAQTSTTHAK